MQSDTGALIEFIASSKELLDFARCSAAVTRYKENQFNFTDYSKKVISLEKKMNSKDDVVAEVFKIAIDRYFNGTNITESVELAIKDVEKKIGANPREIVIKAIRG